MDPVDKKVLESSSRKRLRRMLFGPARGVARDDEEKNTVTVVRGFFMCDICGFPGKKMTRLQKRHTGECQAKYLNRMQTGKRAKTGVRARQMRRKA